MQDVIGRPAREDQPKRHKGPAVQASKDGIGGHSLIISSTASPGQTNFPTNKSNPTLGKAINDDIAKIRSSGDLKKIAEKYGYPVEATEPGVSNLL